MADTKSRVSMLVSFMWTSVYFMIFQGIVSIMAYILSQKLRDKQQHIVCSLCSGERYELNEYAHGLTR
uniref:Uncharacterized protein n=1 Tax=Glossina morsitans morsitans TaxID=37546 RepID=A0A1B0FII1_GLOMM